MKVASVILVGLTLQNNNYGGSNPPTFGGYMKTFQIGRGVEVVCNFENTRYGFRHLANLIIDGRDVETAKCTYQNRTWESYEFQSVLYALYEKVEKQGLLSDYLTKKFKRLIKDNWQVKAKQETDQEFKTVAMVAKMGEFFGANQKESNDWKARMLKAGLENKGLIMPEDWDDLDEDTKQARLDKVIAELSK